MKLNKKMKLANASQSAEKKSTRDGYGKAMVELGEKNKNVVALCADLTESTRLEWFKEKFPEQFIETGVAEQNMLGMAAGLALSGKIPFASSFAVFSPGRNWDQLRVGVCYTNANVKIASSHAGLTVGEDGATHQALEDIAITRVLPNLKVIVPCDFEQAKKATIAAAKDKSPCYLRFGREKMPQVTTENTPFVIGKADIYVEGSDVAIIACGIMVNEALSAAKMLEKKKINAAVVNLHTIKPLDESTIISIAKKCGVVITVEEHQMNGGMGSAVAELLSENYPIPLKRIGVRDSFGESGTPEQLLAKYGLNAENIAKSAENILKLKK
ncbi:MAG: transketolase family protein [Candidatus Micrarchaeota archaeon]